MPAIFIPRRLSFNLFIAGMARSYGLNADDITHWNRPIIRPKDLTAATGQHIPCTTG